MNRYVCLHGHFYQLPRENPWLEKVELEDSAHLEYSRELGKYLGVKTA